MCCDVPCQPQGLTPPKTAEMVVARSVENDVCANDVAVATDEWVLQLEDPIAVYKNNPLYVILFCYLYDKAYVDLWPWDLRVIEHIAIYQKGEPTRADRKKGSWETSLRTIEEEHEPMCLQVPTLPPLLMM